MKILSTLAVCGFAVLGLTACMTSTAVHASGDSTKSAPPKKEVAPWMKNLTPLNESPKREDKVVLSDEAWKKKLTKEQYKILRTHGTEPAFCGIFHDNKKTGHYICAGCDLPLFRSDDKFDSGTGWPSFFQPYDAKESLWYREDTSYNMYRVEVLCQRCDGHLGHVFPDGPKPTGLRFCINSDALKFVEKKD